MTLRDFAAHSKPARSWSVAVPCRFNACTRTKTPETLPGADVGQAHCSMNENEIKKLSIGTSNAEPVSDLPSLSSIYVPGGIG
jgi:hypothetical protein